MKRIVLTFLSLLILLVIFKGTNRMYENEKLISYSSNDIDFLTIHLTMSMYDKIRNQSDIQEIIDFVNQLETIETEPPTPMCGCDSVAIIFDFEDYKKDFRIYLSHNYFFYNNIHYAMNEETYRDFQKLCCKIVKNKYANDSEYGLISGKVISLYNTSSKGSVSCSIQDDLSNIYKIDCVDAEICDICESWLILHENNYIEVIYSKENDKDDYKAVAIFIVPENQS